MGRLSRGAGLGYVGIVTNATSVVTDYYGMLLTPQLHTINLSLQLEYTLAHLRLHSRLSNTFPRSGFTYQALSAPLTVLVAPLRIVRRALETLHLLLLHSLYVSVQRPGLPTLGLPTYSTRHVHVHYLRVLIHQLHLLDLSLQHEIFGLFP